MRLFACLVFVVNFYSNFMVVYRAQFGSKFLPDSSLPAYLTFGSVFSLTVALRFGRYLFCVLSEIGEPFGTFLL